MEVVHKGYRIAIKAVGNGYLARITEAGGKVMPLIAQSSVAEGEAMCSVRARQLIDRYEQFLGPRTEE